MGAKVDKLLLELRSCRSWAVLEHAMTKLTNCRRFWMVPILSVVYISWTPWGENTINLLPIRKSPNPRRRHSSRRIGIWRMVVSFQLIPIVSRCLCFMFFRIDDVPLRIARCRREANDNDESDNCWYSHRACIVSKRCGPWYHLSCDIDNWTIEGLVSARFWLTSAWYKVISCCCVSSFAHEARLISFLATFFFWRTETQEHRPVPHRISFAVDKMKPTSLHYATARRVVTYM